MIALFVRWLAVTGVSFGALAGGYHHHLSENPRRVLVVLDSSYPMRTAWPATLALLDGIAGRRYAEFSLYTEKGRVHGWQRTLAATGVSAYAPRDWSALAALTKRKEFAEADRILLITNARTHPAESSQWAILAVDESARR